jgi:hypothetical protein
VPTTPATSGYLFKRLVLRKPLVTEQLTPERLSNRIALEVLSPDTIWRAVFRYRHRAVCGAAVGRAEAATSRFRSGCS